MEYIPENAAQILSGLSGYHQYRLEGTVLPIYISPNLCQMLGCSQAELLSASEDRYAQWVHPADRERYAAFLRELAGWEQTRTARYRLVRRDGGVLWVSDTVTVSRRSGVLLGDSILTDITELKQENENLRFLNDTMPCGFLKYTCEETPRITYLNDRMRQLLGIPAGESALYTQNVYMMIPVEERRRFSDYLDRVSRQGAPIAGEMTVQRCDGTRAYLFGWVTKCVNDRGEAEFQSACMDITQRRRQQKEQEMQRYIQALTEVYDKIFAYDLSSRTVKCLYARHSPMFRWLENVPMQMEEATEKWILGSVCQEDLGRVRRFFQDLWQEDRPEAETPPVIRYRALSSEGTLKAYSGLFVKVDPAVTLFCCRNLPEAREADSLRSENETLKSMQELVMRFSDGIAAFEVMEDMVTPLYASDNVCQFFGYSREEWLGVMERRTPIREFVARSRADYAQFLSLLDRGQAEFTYYDVNLEKERRIRAVCSQREPGGDGPRYVMLYNVEEGNRETARVQIRTFGYFDVFVDGKPIAFRNEKAKELLALLVDRQGGFVSSEEAISFLWEDESANPVTLARYRKVALRLKNLLEEYGIPEIMESVNGKRRLAAEKVRCDLYDYLSGGPEHAQLFKGSYLTNYSWGENTLAELTGDHLYLAEG